MCDMHIMVLLRRLMRGALTVPVWRSSREVSPRIETKHDATNVSLCSCRFSLFVSYFAASTQGTIGGTEIMYSSGDSSGRLLPILLLFFRPTTITTTLPRRHHHHHRQHRHPHQRPDTSQRTLSTATPGSCSGKSCSSTGALRTPTRCSGCC